MTFKWDVKTYTNKSVCELGNFKLTVMENKPNYFAQVEYHDKNLLFVGNLRTFSKAQALCEQCITNIINECMEIANRYEVEKLTKELEGL